MNIEKLKERILKVGNDLELGIERRNLFFDISEKDWQNDDSGIEHKEISENLEAAKELIFKALAII